MVSRQIGKSGIFQPFRQHGGHPSASLSRILSHRGYAEDHRYQKKECRDPRKDLLILPVFCRIFFFHYVCTILFLII